MAETILAVDTEREMFFEAAQREMIAFEKKEREFRHRAKKEDAAELGLPQLVQSPRRT
jgi:hypothetical protein